MKTFLITLAAFIFVSMGYAQDRDLSTDSTSAPSQNMNTEENAEEGTSRQKGRSKTPAAETGRGNNNTFRDDSTDAPVGMSGLDATPGTSTTTGAGGLGTNENTGDNTSSDIYTIERRDSIKNARKKENAKEKEKARQKVNTRGE